MNAPPSIPSVATRLFWLGFVPGALFGLVDALQTVTAQPHVFGIFATPSLVLAAAREAALCAAGLGLGLGLLGVLWQATVGRIGRLGGWPALHYLAVATILGIAAFAASVSLGWRVPFDRVPVIVRHGPVAGMAWRLVVCSVLGFIAALPALLLLARVTASPGRLSRRAAAMTALGALVLVASARAPQNGHAEGTKPNLVLIVVDALRADRLGCYGYSRPTSPNIDELCAEAIVFDHAIVQFPATGPSFGSLFTGKYPRRHGLSAMDPRRWLGGEFNRTLAEILAGHGYATAAMMTGSLTRSSGLARGFHEVLEEMPAFDLYDVRSPWQALRSRSRLGHAAFKLRRSFESDPVVDRSLAWIDRAARPFFVFVHLYDTHSPYDPPARNIEALDPDYRGPYRVLRAHTLRAIRNGKLALDAAGIHRLGTLYDAEVRTADESIGRIVDHLRRLRELDDTIVVVTADHGEELYEHGVVEHGFIHNTNLRVPLLVRLPGATVSRRLPAPVELIDLMPTLLSHLGFEAPEGIDGEALELAPEGVGDDPERSHFAFAEADCAGRENRSRRDCRVSVQNARWKLDLDIDTGASLLFDLVADPYEQRDVAARHPAVAADLIERLRRWNDEQPDLEGMRRDLEGAAREEVERRLRSLGYIE